MADGELKFLRKSTMRRMVNIILFAVALEKKNKRTVPSTLLWRGVVARREWMDDTVSIYEGPGSHILDRLEWNYWKRRVRKRVHLAPVRLLSLVVLYFIVHSRFSPRSAQKGSARIAAEYNACFLVPHIVASSCGYIVRVEKINALINVV